MSKILYEDNHLLVVVKPCNQLVQEDDTNDLDLLTELKGYIKEKYQKPGNVYLGLVHRLDRPVSGIMVFAKTSKAAARLSDQIRKSEMSKIYQAVVEGKPSQTGTFHDKLLKNQKNNIVIVDPRGKESELSYEVLERKDSYSLVKIYLKTGRSHQIRVQFSSRNYPLYGDQKYNKNAKVGQQIALCATELSFYHPITKELLHFEIDPPKDYPWNLFQ